MARTPLLITPIRCIRRRIRPIRIAAERLGDDSFDPHRVLRRGWRAKEATASASSLVLSDGQRMSRTIYECSVGDRRQYSGIAYLSRFGDEIQNWAIFEPGEINVTDAIDVRPSDADLISALSILGLTIDSV